MPSILPGSGNAKNPSSREMVLGKNDAADDILDQIERSKAQNAQKKLLFISIYSMFQKYPITTCDGCHFRPNGPIDTKFGEGVLQLIKCDFRNPHIKKHI